jgi:ubiquinol-cytochrome c reductase cytochrome b subunit
LPGILFGIGYAWPAIERRYTKDNAMHNLLDFPRNRPKRTAAGAAIFSFVMILFIASSTDVVANYLKLSLNTVLWAMRFLCVIVPLVTYPITYFIAKELQNVHRASQRKTANIVTRTADGEYLAESAPLHEDDEHHELDAVEVPTFLAGVSAEPSTGVRAVER